MAVLIIWPALRIAQTHGWTPPKHHYSSSSTSAEEQYPPETPFQKRNRLAEELVDAYYSAHTHKNGQVPEITDIEDFLLDFIEYEYGIALEDRSELSIAKDLQDMWEECLSGDIKQQSSTSNESMVERFERMARKARDDDADPASAMRGTRTGEGDDSEDSEEDEQDGKGDEHTMDVDEDDTLDLRVTNALPRHTQQVQQMRREEPLVDQDGFMTVPKRKLASKVN